MKHSDLAIIGAYMADGLFTPAIGDNTEYRDLLISTSPGGHIGIVSDICAYAEYALDLRDAAHAVTGDYPGVWEYEVIACFGRWYGARLIETGHQQPTPQQVRVYLLNATQAFFHQCGFVDAHDALAEALCNVVFMDGKHSVKDDTACTSETPRVVCG